MLDLQGYVDGDGRECFSDWFDGLHAPAGAKVAIALTRLEQGNLSQAKSIGSGVYELKIDFGPGYRIYFAKDSDTLVILLGGGTKKRQNKDIQEAKQRWQDYKQRKRKETQ